MKGRESRRKLTKAAEKKRGKIGAGKGSRKAVCGAGNWSRNEEPETGAGKRNRVSKILGLRCQARAKRCMGATAGYSVLSGVGLENNLVPWGYEIKKEMAKQAHRYICPLIVRRDPDATLLKLRYTASCKPTMPYLRAHAQCPPPREARETSWIRYLDVQLTYFFFSISHIFYFFFSPHFFLHLSFPIFRRHFLVFSRLFFSQFSPSSAKFPPGRFAACFSWIETPTYFGGSLLSLFTSPPFDEQSRRLCQVGKVLIGLVWAERLMKDQYLGGLRSMFECTRINERSMWKRTINPCFSETQGPWAKGLKIFVLCAVFESTWKKPQWLSYKLTNSFFSISRKISL